MKNLCHPLRRRRSPQTALARATAAGMTSWTCPSTRRMLRLPVKPGEPVQTRGCPAQHLPPPKPRCQSRPRAVILPCQVLRRNLGHHRDPLRRRFLPFRLRSSSGRTRILLSPIPERPPSSQPRASCRHLSRLYRQSPPPRLPQAYPQKSRRRPSRSTRRRIPKPDCPGRSAGATKPGAPGRCHEISLGQDLSCDLCQSAHFVAYLASISAPSTTRIHEKCEPRFLQNRSGDKAKQAEMKTIQCNLLDPRSSIC